MTLLTDTLTYDDWIVVIESEVDALFDDSEDAYALGYAHGLMAHPCREGVYERLHHQVDYRQGYKDALATLDYEDWLVDSEREL